MPFIIWILNKIFPNATNNAQKAFWILVVLGILIIGALGLWLNSCLSDWSRQQALKQEAKIDSNISKIEANIIQSEVIANQAANNSKIIENRVKERQPEINKRISNINTIRNNSSSNVDVNDLIRKGNELYNE